MSSVPTSPLPPPHVPDHELIRRIGRGAYGEVWIARSVTGAYRAVKIVHRQSFDHDRPFEREFEGIQKFEPVSRTHDSQVDILHVGRGEDYFYYVMELADDQSTGGQINPDRYAPRTLKSDLMFHGRIPFEECVRIGLALATALEHLHAAGLVHRDVKPSNIIFVNGVPKLADIGLVTGVDATRSYVGTEGFAAPEGSGTAQADLFSLGKVLYEISTGKDRQEFPELPTQLRELPDRDGLMELNAVIAKACRHDPKDRYPSAAAMRADLELLQGGKSLARLHRMQTQLRLVRRVGVLVTMLAVIIGGGWLWQARQTRMVRELADEKSRLVEEKSKLAGENRQRIVRLDIANGVRVLDEGDPAAALLWFADALPLVTNNAAETSIHRIRIQQTLRQLPRPVQFLTHDQGVKSMGFSSDGKRFVASTESGWVHVWDAHTGDPLLKPLQLNSDTIREVRFTPDGQRLLMRTQSSQGPRVLTAAILNATTGQTLFSKVATNLARMSFSSDGRWLVTARLDHVIEVLDIRDESRALATLKGHTREVLRLTVNSNVLLSVSADRTLRLWRLPSGEPIGDPLSQHDLERNQHPPVLSRDGRLLATRERVERNDVPKDYIHIWRTDTLTRVGEPIESPGLSGTIAWLDSPRGWRLLDTYGGRIRVLDADTQAELFPPVRRDRQNDSRDIFDVSRDGRRLVFGGRGGLDGLWSLETGETLAPPFQHGRQIMDVAISPDGSQCSTLTDDGTCTLWNVNLRTQNAIHRFNANTPGIPKGPPQRLLKRFSPDRRRLLIPLDDGTARLVDVERMAEQDMPGSNPAHHPSYHLIFAPDNQQWAIAYAPTNEQGSPVVELWRDEAGTLKHQTLPHSKGIQNTGFAPRSTIVAMWHDDTGTGRYSNRPWSHSVRNMRFAPDSASLITICEDRQTRTWRTHDGTLERSVTAPETIDEIGELFPDGRMLFVVDRNIGFAVFDLVTGSLTPVAVGSGNVTALAFDSAGERFATVTELQWGRVWNTKTGAPLSPPVPHDGPLTWVDWSPDGKRIAMAGATSEVRVWDAATGELSLPPLRLGDKPLGTVTWSLDGRFLVARSNEKSVRVWDSITGEAVTPLLKHNGDVRLAHLVANNRLITLSSPNVLRAWDLTETRLPIDVIADYAKLVAGRKLNAGGVLVPLKANELAELNRSLRARAPQLFE